MKSAKFKRPNICALNIVRFIADVWKHKSLCYF